MYLDIYSYSYEKDRRLNDLERIFFASSIVKEFRDENHKQTFFEIWAGRYVTHWPDDAFFACEDQSKETMGYLLGCRDSMKALPILSEGSPTYELFADLYKVYPAHLHVDIDAKFQGKGVGTFLIQEYVVELKKHGIKGLHAITAHGDANNAFYEKNGFKAVDFRTFNGKELVFYAQKLSRSFFF